MGKIWLLLAIVGTAAFVMVVYELVAFCWGLLYAVHTGQIFQSDWLQWAMSNWQWLVPLAFLVNLWRVRRVQNEFAKLNPWAS